MPSQTKKITLDTAALFFGRAVGLLLGVVRLNYLATYLGVANFGILNFATYFTALFQTLFDLGMAQLITREISRDPSQSSQLLGRTIVLKTIIVFVASLLVGLVTLISGFDRVTNWAVLLTTAALAINGISMVFLSAFQAHRKMVTVSIANIANDAIISGAIILLIPLFPSVVTALALIVFVSVVNLGVLVGVYYKIVGAPEYGVDLNAWKLMLKEGTPMAVSALGISTYTFIGPTILKYYRGEAEVGLYSAGFKLISILTLVPTAFTQIVFPIFSSFLSYEATGQLQDHDDLVCRGSVGHRNLPGLGTSHLSSEASSPSSAPWLIRAPGPFRKAGVAKCFSSVIVRTVVLDTFDALFIPATYFKNLF